MKNERQKLSQKNEQLENLLSSVLQNCGGQFNLIGGFFLPYISREVGSPPRCLVSIHSSILVIYTCMHIHVYPLHVLKLSRDINFNKTGNVSFSVCDRLKFKIYGTAES